jgi:hypothetical protein
MVWGLETETKSPEEKRRTGVDIEPRRLRLRITETGITPTQTKEKKEG